MERKWTNTCNTTVNIYPQNYTALKNMRSTSSSCCESNKRNSKTVPFSVDDIPASLRGPQYDAVIVYSPEEEADMMKFKYIVENYIKMTETVRPKVYMCCCDSSPNFSALEDVLERTSVFFIYSSGDCFGDNCANYKKDEIVSRCIQQPWNRLVPLLPNKTHEPIPGMKALKALYLQELLCGKSMAEVTLKHIEYSGSECFAPAQVNALVRLFNHGLLKKQERLAKQQKKLKAWIREQIRNSEIKTAVTQENKQVQDQTNRCEISASHTKLSHSRSEHLSPNERVGVFDSKHIKSDCVQTTDGDRKHVHFCYSGVSEE